VTVGTAIRHPEWAERTLGEMVYAGDVRLRGTLVGLALRSPHPHAEIRSIDFSAAEQAKGVRAVITARDFSERNYRDYGTGDRWPIARGRTIYHGHEVAVVAADTLLEAKRAVGLIKVRYRVRKAATTLEASLRPGAPVVHPERAPDNVATSAVRRFGEPDAARRAASHVVRGRYGCGIQAHACMEPQSVLAQWEADTGLMNIWTPTQSPRSLQSEIAWVLGLGVDRVRLHRVAVGGDFGSRVKTSDIEVLSAMLSRKSGFPVCMAFSRSEEFALTKRQHECWIDLETGADQEHVVRYRAAKVTVENGAFIHGGSNMMNYCSILLGSQYRLEGAEIAGQSIYTHRRPGGAFRGAGGPQAVFAIESQMDELAEQLGVDPIELRLRNLNREGDETITGWRIESARAAACLETVRRELGWDAARNNGGNGRGVGVALAIHVSGAIVSAATAHAEVSIEIGHNGGVVLSSGCSDPGTGETALIAQICANELGVELDQIVVRTMDTMTTPYDPGAGASRATMITGGAVSAAARRMADMLRDAAAVRFNVAPESVQLEAGFACSGAKRVPIGEIAASHSDAVAGVLRLQHDEVVSNPIVPLTAADPGFGNLSPAYSFAAHGVEIEVDSETGAVRVLRVVAAHDAGTVINPVGAEGQVVGGVVMGIGAALGEQLLYDGGRQVVTSYADYAMPRATEAPPVNVIFVDGASTTGPHGGKSVAEIALMPIAPAIANAIAHATGVRIRDLPISPDKIVRAMHERNRAPEKIRSILARPDRWWSDLVRRAYPLGLREALHRWGPSTAAHTRCHGEMLAFLRPSSSEEVTAALSAETRPAGGGTDLLALADQGFSLPARIVGTIGCTDMRDVAFNNGDLAIGGAVTLAGLLEALVPRRSRGEAALRETVEHIATPQLRETATVAGNLCQAKRCWFYRSGFDCYKRGGFARPCYAVSGDHRYYHAVLGAGRCQAVTPSDLATTLTALEAVIDIRSARHARRLPIEELYTGPGETALADDELLHSIIVPAHALRRATHFVKKAMTSDGFAIVSACASLAWEKSGALHCRAVLGGVANIPYRALPTEAVLAAEPVDEQRIKLAAHAWANQAHPLRDNGWKITAASAVLRRALTAAHDDLTDAMSPSRAEGGLL
jgi:CO/xanthine dehydrogenase Mo-binding subunit/CO/xanthine dehydrogenase FAD-binding subunit